jgi:dihydrolipoamide dehydrogenase
MSKTGSKKFDLVVIGSGPGGYLSAILTSRKGLSIAVVEKAELGGTCLNRGCIPMKALLREAILWDAFSKSGWVKERNDNALAYKKALEKKEAAVNQVVSGLRNLLNRDRISVIQGEASFVNPQTLIIKNQGSNVERIESERILIATGSIPKEIPDIKMDGQWVLGSDDALEMENFPSDIAIIGGGRRGVEFATFFSTFGTKVTLIERENRILPKMDREISVRFKSLLRKRNIKVLTEAEAMSSNIGERNGSLNLKILLRGKEEELEVQKVLIVADRRGNLDGLDIEKASLSPQDGFIPVDLQMRTSTAGIYAVGDVVGRGHVAHKAFHEAKIAVENIMGKATQANYRLIPICLYAQPEAASIGLTQEEAEEKYGEVKSGTFPFMGCGRAVASGEKDGMVKIISDRKYGEILGVHILGSGATEMIHLGAMAMKQEMVLEELKEMVFAHPTFSEAFFEAALDTDGEAIHIMKN